VRTADDTKQANEVHTKLVEGILRNGKITTTFERKGKDRVTYWHIPHSRMETRYIAPLHAYMD
jgi:hypothetical protein